MVNELEMRSVRCLVTCDNMSILRGDVCCLPLPRARTLHSQGNVKIMDEKVLHQHNTNKNKDGDYLYRATYSDRRMTKVAWVQNYSKNGGAEISNFTAVRIGCDLGFDTVGCVVGDGPLQISVLDKADIVIVNNLHCSGREELFKWLFSTHKPWIKYDHDLCEEEAELYRKAALNVFISPMHMAYYVAMCGEEIAAKSICLPLAFDVDAWKYPNMNGRIKNSVFIPCYAKCRKEAQEFVGNHPEYSYYVAGHLKPFGLNVNLLGDIIYTDMNEAYGKYENVLHTPNAKCAGERILFEAVMSGCKVITNDNAGHTSWDFDWRDVKVLKPILKNAVYLFWKEVERVTYGK